MKTLSEIEKRLLDAELKLIQEALLRCMNQLKNVLADIPHTGHKDLEEINEWIRTSCEAVPTYGAGGWVLSTKQPSTSNLPESFKTALLKRATDKFFERLESLEEITNDLEDRI